MVSYLCVSVSVQYVLSDMSVTPLQLCILTYRWEKLLSTRPKLKKKKKTKVSTSEWGQALVVSSSHVTIYSYQTANESGKAPAHTLVLKSQNHNVLQNKHIHKSISSKPASLSLWPYVSLPCYKSFKITQINWQQQQRKCLFFAGQPVNRDVFGRYIIPVYLSCSVPLVFFGGEQSHSGHGDRLLRWQATVSELTCFLWLCLSEQRLPKKDAASWGPHSGTFPSDPSLKASTAAEEIRDSHRVSLNSITTGEDRSSSDWSGLLTGPSMSKHLHPARITSPGL